MTDEKEIPFITPFVRIGRVLPLMVSAAMLATTIGKFLYHLQGQALMVGAAVPLTALFLLTRVLIFFGTLRPRRGA